MSLPKSGAARPGDDLRSVSVVKLARDPLLTGRFAQRVSLPIRR